MKADRRISLRFIRAIAAAVMLTVCLAANARTYLVSVGVADYSGFPEKLNNLKSTTTDARSIADIYATNTQVDYTLLLDKKATRDRILRAITQLFKKAGKDDIVVFYFSGHGYTGGFCAADGDLSYADIRKAMSGSKCPNKMMFIDSCHSGSMRSGGRSNQSAAGAAKKASVMLFLSSRNNETSSEGLGMNNGLFTTYLLRGLGGKADTDGNRVITARELYDYVHGNVTRYSNDAQHPVMWGNFMSTMPVMKW